MSTAYRFGIEEELFLADAETRGRPRRVKAFHQQVQARIPQVERELLQAQIEIMTPPCSDFAQARVLLAGLRSSLAEIGRGHDVLLLASGTSPLAFWRRQARTRKDRYDAIAEDMQMLARRDVVCGMHVHVEVPQPERRVDVMNRLLPFTPVLLALSASSPFWQGEDTGLDAYRLSVWGEMPRTGLPELFRDQLDYDRYVAAMVKAKAIKDGSFLWWTLRPSIRFPTLELRVSDSCTRLEDALAIAALFRCLVRLVCRTPTLNRSLTSVSRAIVSENMWRAQRRGIHAAFIDEEGGLTPYSQHLDDILDTVKEDAEALGCVAEVARTRAIAHEGTSADRQRAIFAEAGSKSANRKDALHAVVDWIAAETVQTRLPATESL